MITGQQGYWGYYGARPTPLAASSGEPDYARISLVALGVVVVFGAGGGYILKMIRKGPQPIDDGPDHDDGERTPMRPISAADGPVGDD